MTQTAGRNARPPGARHRRLRAAAILAALATVAWFVARSVGTQWTQFRDAAAELHPRWSLVIAASALVLATYALLIQAWRALVTGWGGRLAFWSGARIWTVSNLARYVPGTLWSVGAMSVLADDAGVPPAAAAGAAIFNTVLNLAAGFVVLSATGGEYVARLAPGVPHPRAFGAAVGVAGAVALPLCLPFVTTALARVLRRERPPAPPFRTFVAALLSNLVAWCTYGIAFGCFARAVLPAVGDNWVGYIAVFTGSYLTGFLALVAPGGLFVREAAMVYALTRTGMASPGDAAVLAVAQRLWLTVLELAPGLTFLAAGGLRARAARSPATSD